MSFFGRSSPWYGWQSSFLALLKSPSCLDWSPLPSFAWLSFPAWSKKSLVSRHAPRSVVQHPELNGFRDREPDEHAPFGAGTAPRMCESLSVLAHGIVCWSLATGLAQACVLKRRSEDRRAGFRHECCYAFSRSVRPLREWFDELWVEDARNEELGSAGTDDSGDFRSAGLPPRGQGRFQACAGPSGRGCLSPGTRLQSHQLTWTRRALAGNDNGDPFGSLSAQRCHRKQSSYFPVPAVLLLGRWPFLRANSCHFFKQRDPAHILRFVFHIGFERTPAEFIPRDAAYGVTHTDFALVYFAVRLHLKSQPTRTEIPPCRRCFVVESERFVSVLDHDRRRKHRPNPVLRRPFRTTRDEGGGCFAAGHRT